MHLKYNISLIALAATLAAAPSVSAQVLDLDADVNVGGESGVSADADVSVGGEDGVNADANVDLGSDTDADVNVTLGGDGESGGSDGLSVDADVGLPGGEEAVDADVTIGGAEGDGATIDGNVRLLALSDQDAQVDLFIGLLGDSGLANVDLDAAIDDQSVSIIPVDDIFDESAMAEIQLALGSGADGIEETQAAIAASAELRSILDGEGISPDAVLALQIGADGATDVFVEGGATPELASLSIGLGDSGDDGAGGDDGAEGDGGAGDDAGAAGGRAGDGAVVGDDGDDGEGVDFADSGAGLAGGSDIAIDVANLDCPAGLEAMVSASNITPSLLNSISEISVIAISGCPAGGVATADDVEQIQAAIRQEEDLLRAVESQGFTAENVIGAVAQGDTLVLYIFVAAA